VIVIDVNILVAAFFGDHARHKPAVAFLNRAVTSLGPAIVPDVVWSGFARVVTTPGLLDPTPAWPDVRAYIEKIRSHPGHARSVRALDADLDVFLELSERSDARRNIVSDAYIAAIALANACPVGTFDRDFRRFDGVEVIVPGQG
jgi:toxin-antitoxin system PIN domain toxin